MPSLKDFLSTLATDPQKVGEFIHNPEGTMKAAELSEDDVAAMKSGFPALIHARLAGVPIQDVFKATLRPPVSPQQFVFPVQMQQLSQFVQPPLQVVHLPPLLQQLPARPRTPDPEMSSMFALSVPYAAGVASTIGSPKEASSS